MNFVTNSKYFAALLLEIINLQGAQILSEITSNTYAETRDAPGENRIYILPLQNRRQRYEKLGLY